MDRVFATDYGNWPPAARLKALAPIHEWKIPQSELESFVLDSLAGRVTWRAPDLGMPLFPKIAVCSWKCFPWLLPSRPGDDLALYCSPRMRAVLKNWVDMEMGCYLRFFPYRDFARVDEFRFEIRGERMSLQRSVVRSELQSGNYGAQIREFASQLVGHLDNVIVDVAAEQIGTKLHIWIIELNPLTRKISHAS